MRKAPTPPPQPADAALIECADQVKTAMAALAATAAKPLYDPHTLFRVLDRLTPAIKSAAETVERLQERLEGADRHGLLLADYDDIDIASATSDAYAALNQGRRLLLDVANELSEAEQATAGFAPRKAATS